MQGAPLRSRQLFVRDRRNQRMGEPDPVAVDLEDARGNRLFHATSGATGIADRIGDRHDGRLREGGRQQEHLPRCLTQAAQALRHQEPQVRRHGQGI